MTSPTQCKEINDIVRLFLAHQYYTAIKWLRYCRYSVNHYLINQSLLYTQVVSPLPSSGEKDYIKKAFYTYYPKIIFLEWGSWNLQISCLLTLQMLLNKFGKDWPSSFLRRLC